MAKIKVKKSSKKETVELILIGFLILVGGAFGVFLMTRSNINKYTVEKQTTEEQISALIYRYEELLSIAPWNSSIDEFKKFIADSLENIASIKVKRHILNLKENYNLKNEKPYPEQVEIVEIKTKGESVYFVSVKEYFGAKGYYPVDFIVRKEENNFVIENIIRGELITQEKKE